MLFSPVLLIVIIVVFSKKKRNDELFSLMKRQLLLSYSAYCPEKQLQTFNCYWCNISNASLQNITVYEDRASHLLFYVGFLQDLETLVVLIRGTVDPFTDIISMILDSDARHINNPFGPGKIERGYWTCYKFLQENFVRVLTTYFKEFTINKLILSGHSLGSVLVSLGTIELVQSIPKVKQIKENNNLKIFTFGSPRLGDSVFRDFYMEEILSKDHIFRIVNQKDMVPHWPGEMLNYVHLPTEYWFKKDYENYVKCDGSGEDKSCSDSVSMLDYSLKEHLSYLGYKILRGAVPPYWCADS